MDGAGPTEGAGFHHDHAAAMEPSSIPLASEPDPHGLPGQEPRPCPASPARPPQARVRAPQGRSLCSPGRCERSELAPGRTSETSSDPPRTDERDIIESTTNGRARHHRIHHERTSETSSNPPRTDEHEPNESTTNARARTQRIHHKRTSETSSAPPRTGLSNGETQAEQTLEKYMPRFLVSSVSMWVFCSVMGLWAHSLPSDATWKQNLRRIHRHLFSEWLLNPNAARLHFSAKLGEMVGAGEGGPLARVSCAIVPSSRSMACDTV